MNFLSLFVLIPLVMLLGLWLARDVKGVRAVMVTGSSLLLILAGYLTITFLGDRAAGATGEMLYTASVNWFEPLHIKYSVGVDGISVAMLLLSADKRQGKPNALLCKRYGVSAVEVVSDFDDVHGLTTSTIEDTEDAAHQEG